MSYQGYYEGLSLEYNPKYLKVFLDKNTEYIQRFRYLNEYRIVVKYYIKYKENILFSRREIGNPNYYTHYLIKEMINNMRDGDIINFKTNITIEEDVRDKINSLRDKIDLEDSIKQAQNKPKNIHKI